MNTQTIVTILCSGVLFTAILGFYDRLRNRRFEKTKQGTGLKLDSAQYNEIVARTEQTSSSNMIAVGAFWQGQFSEVTKRLDAEQEWRKRMKVRLHEHRTWDRKLLARLSPDVISELGEPPSLDPDDDA